MSKSKKIMLTAILLAVIAMVSVPSTMSWLSYKSSPVVNTFAGGSISIKVDESKVDADGHIITGEGAERVNGNSYKYVAGAVYDKDPTATVLKGSEECYVFLCVENQLSDKFTANYDTKSWLKVGESGDKAVYAYKATVDAENSDGDIVLEPIFRTITVSENLTSEDVKELGEKKLTVTAFAVQTDSLSSNAAVDLAVAEFLPEGTEVTYPEIA